MQLIYRAHQCDEPGCGDAPVVVLLGYHPDALLQKIYVAFSCAPHVAARRDRANAVLRVPNGAPLIISVSVQPDELFTDKDFKAMLEPHVIRAALSERSQ